MRPVIILVSTAIVIFSLLLFLNAKTNDKIKKEETKMIRHSAVAGSFYPEDKQELQKQINGFLSQAEKKIDKTPNILIVPHAGYDYSGWVAAAGFKQIEGKAISKVILVGPSHQSWFTGVAIDQNDSWQTPLGKVEIDKTLAKNLIDKENNIFFSSQPHVQEHSLEVEIPFLQIVLRNFKIVPIIFSNANEQVIKKLADLIYQNMDQETLLLISSDLSHYPDYQTANQVDQKTINSILSGNQEKFSQTINQQVAEGQPGLETCACGEKAIRLAMLISQKLGQGKWQLIKYANSGDVGIKNKTKVVGYAAISWTAKGNLDQLITKHQDDQEEEAKLLKIARESLTSYLKEKKIPEYQINNPKLEEKLGAFVTLNKNHQLRGCIGEFKPQTPLWQTVQKKVIDAALNDPRFPPVTLEELADIEIEISILSKPRKIDNWKEVKLGKDGVLLKQGTREGTFLPQVATETGWSLKEFLSQLCFQKAGLPKDCYKDKKTELYVYTAEVFSESDMIN